MCFRDRIERWKEPIGLVIILACMVVAVITLAVGAVILGINVANGTQVEMNVIGCVFFAACCVIMVRCFIGMIRA